MKNNKFEIKQNETQYKDGNASLLRPWTASPCHVYLTSERIVVCKKSFFLMGLFGVLSLLFKSKKVTEEVLLKDLSNIKKSSHLFGTKFTFLGVDGNSFSLKFTTASFGNDWVNAIILAKKNTDSTVSVTSIGDSTEFKKAA